MLEKSLLGITFHAKMINHHRFLVAITFHAKNDKRNNLSISVFEVWEGSPSTYVNFRGFDLKINWVL